MSASQSTVLTTTPPINTTKILSNAISTSIPAQIHHVIKYKCKKFPELPFLTQSTKNHTVKEPHAATSNSIQVSNYIGI